MSRRRERKFACIEKSNIFFSLFFLSTSDRRRLLLAKLKRPVFIKFSKDTQMPNIFNQTRFTAQFSNKGVHH